MRVKAWTSMPWAKTRCLRTRIAAEHAASLHGPEAVAAAVVRARAAEIVEIGVGREGALRVCLPDLEHGIGHRVAGLVHHRAGNDDPLTRTRISQVS
jgi:hypothetical protein